MIFYGKKFVVFRKKYILLVCNLYIYIYLIFIGGNEFMIISEDDVLIDDEVIKIGRIIIKING